MIASCSIDRLVRFPLILAIGGIAAGCHRAERPADPPLTASSVRAERRAYDGAPPVIPHEPLKASCVTCHTDTGKPVPGLAFAPANPHGDRGVFENCRQCHVFQRSERQFVENDYEPLPVTNRKGDRLFSGAPPTIPHPIVMRANCLACHSGPSARAEIRCTHPERAMCVQCHVASNPEISEPTFASSSPGAP